MDTGFGIADLKSYVEEITSLPLMVVNSHVHPDHSGGNRQFDTVYIGENEWSSTEGVVFPIETVPHGKVHPAVLFAGNYQFDFLHNGQWIDLGDRRLQVISIPGHTKGSIALYDEESHYLFSGDAIVKRIFYGAKVPLSQYKNALLGLKNLPIKEILSAHWPQPLPVAFIDKILYLIDTFDPNQSEPAVWDIPGAPDLRMFHYGKDFDDPEFVAISFAMEQLDDIMK